MRCVDRWGARAIALFFLAGAARVVFAADQTCTDPAPSPPASGVCSVTAGDGARLLRGKVLLPDGIASNGSVLINASGVIACAGCGCQSAPGAATATRIDCAHGVISPGLIDLRNLLTFSQNAPASDTGERYEHRHEWRIGTNGHTKIIAPGGATTAQIQWAELRSLMTGVTSVSSSGSVANLLRNLTTASRLDGLTGVVVAQDTFPLGDFAGGELASGCAYPSLPTVPATGRYEFVAGEGINAEARNEFLCLSGLQAGGVDVLTNASVIAAIPLRASDAQVMAQHGASVVWQPRNDLRLYGMTAPATVFDALGVPLALGTVWTPTGSAQLQRELACADSYNTTYLWHHFNDAALWKMVTANAAVAAGFATEIGQLATTHVGDVAVFDANSHAGYRAVIDAQTTDVVLVLKGGLPMYGEDSVLAALGGGDGVCDALDVCGSARRLCVQRETGTSLSALGAVNASNYPLFQCGALTNEPTCKPTRSAPNLAPLFTGDPVPGDGDGDGVPDAADVCPAVFDPPRPVDGLVQIDSDNDGIGDACDPCPLDSTNACDVIFRDGFQ
jgi:cytosine/adenosine deaminase-related metal-dependent hydrolase